MRNFTTLTFYLLKDIDIVDYYWFYELNDFEYEGFDSEIDLEIKTERNQTEGISHNENGINPKTFRLFLTS